MPCWKNVNSSAWNDLDYCLSDLLQSLALESDSLRRLILLKALTIIASHAMPTSLSVFPSTVVHAFNNNIWFELDIMQLRNYHANPSITYRWTKKILKNLTNYISNLFCPIPELRIHLRVRAFN